MDLSRRLTKLENRSTPPGDWDSELANWASLFSKARADWDGQVLEEDLLAAREFINDCRAIGEKPSFKALLILADQEESLS